VWSIASSVGVAQSPGPVASLAPTAEPEESDDTPWGRLVIFIPLSIVIGAGAAAAWRYARERGWTQS
jgi:hypothetical protein